MIIFTILFPAFFVIIEKSNLYSSWRQFLFLYPGIVLLAATGFNYFFDILKRRWIKWTAAAFLVVLSIHPAGYILRNMPYSYMYYNQLVGGLKGALGNYETDYYYISHREASKWLARYLEEKNIKTPVKIGATYSVDWFFRNHSRIETSVFRNEERSQSDWDYAIIVNRYISPFKLKKSLWPPKNAIHVVYADSVPVCAVIERRTKDDFKGYTALNEGRNSDAIKYFEKALKSDDGDEMIFYNFALALYNEKQYLKADSVLKKAIDLNPDFEPALMYLGNIAKSNGRSDEAVMYYERVLKADRKYFEAYVCLAELVVGRDLNKARFLLKTCLTINPGFRPAIMAMADTYRSSEPDIARKYDELANRIK
jgi:tetratricopeptide (TPR) repeat protein